MFFFFFCILLTPWIEHVHWSVLWGSDAVDKKRKSGCITACAGLGLGWGAHKSKVEVWLLLGTGSLIYVRQEEQKYMLFVHKKPINPFSCCTFSDQINPYFLKFPLDHHKGQNSIAVIYPLSILFSNVFEWISYNIIPQKKKKSDYLSPYKILTPKGYKQSKDTYRLDCVWGCTFWLHHKQRWGGSKGRHRTTKMAWGVGKTEFEWNWNVHIRLL